MSARPVHNRRYAIDPTLICNELEWQARHTLKQGLESTLRWFIDTIEWCETVLQRSSQSRG